MKIGTFVTGTFSNLLLTFPSLKPTSTYFWNPSSERADICIFCWTPVGIALIVVDVVVVVVVVVVVDVVVVLIRDRQWIFFDTNFFTPIFLHQKFYFFTPILNTHFLHQENYFFTPFFHTNIFIFSTNFFSPNFENDCLEKKWCTKVDPIGKLFSFRSDRLAHSWTERYRIIKFLGNTKMEWTAKLKRLPIPNSSSSCRWHWCIGKWSKILFIIRCVTRAKRMSYYITYIIRYKSPPTRNTFGLLYRLDKCFFRFFIHTLHPGKIYHVKIIKNISYKIGELIFCIIYYRRVGRYPPCLVVKTWSVSTGRVVAGRVVTRRLVVHGRRVGCFVVVGCG